jgi:hypothetical protein
MQTVLARSRLPFHVIEIRTACSTDKVPLDREHYLGLAYMRGVPKELSAGRRQTRPQKFVRDADRTVAPTSLAGAGRPDLQRRHLVTEPSLYRFLLPTEAVRGGRVVGWRRYYIGGATAWAQT